jgi:hypothetical protein
MDGAQEENRTPDLRITSALLYRLSYLGASGNASAAESNGLPLFILLWRMQL